MLDSKQEQNSFTAIELANQLSEKIASTTNRVFTPLSSFEDLIESDSIFLLEENDWRTITQ
jgi:hypothetical protein